MRGLLTEYPHWRCSSHLLVVSCAGLDRLEAKTGAASWTGSRTQLVVSPLGLVSSSHLPVSHTHSCQPKVKSAIRVSHCSRLPSPVGQTTGLAHLARTFGKTRAREPAVTTWERDLFAWCRLTACGVAGVQLRSEVKLEAPLAASMSRTRPGRLASSDSAGVVVSPLHMLPVCGCPMRCYACDPDP